MFGYEKLKSVGYAMFSVFIVWHLIAITIVGPWANSYMRDALMTVYQPYLTLLNLNRSWPFYAPNPFLGSILEYETVDSEGIRSIYPLTQAREKYQHAYFRYTNYYAYLFSDPDYTKERGYDVSTARYLCSQHGNRSIESITFILWQQKEFTYKDYRAGKDPLDEAFLKRKEFGPYACENTVAQLGNIE